VDASPKGLLKPKHVLIIQGTIYKVPPPMTKIQHQRNMGSEELSGFHLQLAPWHPNAPRKSIAQNPANITTTFATQEQP